MSGMRNGARIACGMRQRSLQLLSLLSLLLCFVMIVLWLRSVLRISDYDFVRLYRPNRDIAISIRKGCVQFDIITPTATPNQILPDRADSAGEFSFRRMTFNGSQYQT